MARILILLALAFFLAYLAGKGMARLQSRFREFLKPPTAGRRMHGSELVACANCGVHVPQSRALEAPGGARPALAAARFFCSEDCRRQAQPVPEAVRTTSA